MNNEWIEVKSIDDVPKESENGVLVAYDDGSFDGLIWDEEEKKWFFWYENMEHALFEEDLIITHYMIPSPPKQ